MKIEAEVEPSAVYAFHQGGGCSEPSAQERRSASIDRPAEWQQQQQQQAPGCGGGCGPPASSSSDEEHHHNNGSSSNSVVPPSSALFDCEHFQFIDEDEDEDEDPVRSSHDEDDAPAGEEDMAAPAPAPTPPQLRSEDDDMGESESVAAKRQASSLDEAAPARPRSVLKRTTGGGGKRPRNSHRVTFDEAVTLYSGESEDGVQTLALTTGPDIVYTDVFYTFEPPIEYQDVPPFEPPAEYRDSSDDAPPQPDVSDSGQQTESETNLPEQQSEVRPNPSDEQTGNNEEQQQQPPEPADDRSDVAVSQETVHTDSAAAYEPPVAQRPDCAQRQESSSSLESDELFERFLEAEREFAVDEELNSVFHALEADFSSDDKNGALDDNFFRKLISLLSSAEAGGDPDATSDYFSEPNLAKWQSDLDDDNSQAHSRTLSEADSDCSISSQDTIIVRFGEEDGELVTPCEPSTPLLYVKPEDSSSASDPVRDAADSDSSLTLPSSERFDEVFTEVSESSSADERPPRPTMPLLVKGNHVAQAVAKLEKVNGESLSRQSSGEQSVNSGNSQDPPQDADDSTSSDSRSGEVEEEIRLDDIGYDEEDAEDYDEESFRGMAHGNSKIRRIIKKNALQCTLFRGIEAKRRQQPGAKYPRPKSPLLSQESLVEKLKWLTTIDEHKDADGAPKFHSKPPDVILSTGGVPVNGSIPHSASSEDDQAAQNFQGFYQQRHVMPPNSGGAYYVRRDGFPPTHHPSLPRQRVAYPQQTMVHTLPHQQNRVVAHPSNPQQVQWCEQQQQQPQQQQRPPASSMTVPRNFRDWRIIQRITGNRGGDGHRSQVAADYVRCPPNGGFPPDVQQQGGRQAGGKDELEQFVEKDSRRLDMIRKRYSVAEEEDDPTFGFARRPSVRGVQNRIQSSSNPSDNAQGHKMPMDPYAAFALDEPQALVHPRSAYPGEQVRIWSRDPNWRPDPSQPHYGPPMPGGRSLHVHRASVALTELPGSATIPYAHRKPHPDPRYHSYAESMYGSTRTLPTQGGWPDPRLCHETLPTFANMPAVSPPMLQVPPHSVKDERGVPEGASSSPKISSDSLYPVPDAIASTGGPHKEDGGMIYYSLNV